MDNSVDFISGDSDLGCSMGCIQGFSANFSGCPDTFDFFFGIYWDVFAILNFYLRKRLGGLMVVRLLNVIRDFSLFGNFVSSQRTSVPITLLESGIVVETYLKPSLTMPLSSSFLSFDFL